MIKHQITLNECNHHNKIKPITQIHQRVETLQHEIQACAVKPKWSLSFHHRKYFICKWSSWRCSIHKMSALLLRVIDVTLLAVNSCLFKWEICRYFLLIFPAVIVPFSCLFISGLIADCPLKSAAFIKQFSQLNKPHHQCMQLISVTVLNISIFIVLITFALEYLFKPVLNKLAVTSLAFRSVSNTSNILKHH